MKIKERKMHWETLVDILAARIRFTSKKKKKKTIACTLRRCSESSCVVLRYLNVY